MGRGYDLSANFTDNWYNNKVFIKAYTPKNPDFHHLYRQLFPHLRREQVRSLLPYDNLTDTMEKVRGFVEMKLHFHSLQIHLQYIPQM